MNQSQSRPSKRLVRSISLAVCLAIVGCNDGTGPTQFLQPRAKPEWVVGQAAAALDTVSGLFRLSLPVGLHVGLATAETLALAAADLYASPGPFNSARSFLERDRGAAIDFDHLKSCARVTYAYSAFVDFPAEMPAYIRRARGSEWAIPLCGGDGTVHLSVGVPDNPTDLRVVDGELQVPDGGGSAYFSSAGVPLRFPWGLPLTPESAVEVVFKWTGRRVSSVPVAYEQRDDSGFGQIPLCASWRIGIEHPVTVRRESSGELSSITEFFVRRGPACYSDDVLLYAAATTQPANVWLVFPQNTTSDDSAAVLDSAEVMLAGPVRFDKVTVVR